MQSRSIGNGIVAWAHVSLGSSPVAPPCTGLSRRWSSVSVPRLLSLLFFPFGFSLCDYHCIVLLVLASLLLHHHFPQPLGSARQWSILWKSMRLASFSTISPYCTWKVCCSVCIKPRTIFRLTLKSLHWAAEAPYPLSLLPHNAEADWLGAVADQQTFPSICLEIGYSSSH